MLLDPFSAGLGGGGISYPLNDRVRDFQNAMLDFKVSEAIKRGLLFPYSVIATSSVGQPALTLSNLCQLVLSEAILGNNSSSQLKASAAELGLYMQKTKT